MSPIALNHDEATKALTHPVQPVKVELSVGRHRSLHEPKTVNNIPSFIERLATEIQNLILNYHDHVLCILLRSF